MKEALGRQLFLEKKETEEGKASPAARFFLKPFLNGSIFMADRESVEAVQEKAGQSMALDWDCRLPL